MQPTAPDADTEQRILDAAHAVFLRRGTAGALFPSVLAVMTSDASLEEKVHRFVAIELDALRPRDAYCADDGAVADA